MYTVALVTTIETTHATIAYDERGSDLPLVLLASGAHDRHDYDELRDLLPPHIRTIAIDWPGHGESSPPRTSASVIQFAEVAESVVSQLCPEGAVVMGNSVGGFAAARLAITRPDLVKGLVIVDGGGFVPRSLLLRGFCAAMGRPRFLRRIYPSFSRRYMRARTPGDARALATAVATTREDPGLRTVTDLWRSFSSKDHDLRADAAEITAPTLVIWGAQDPVIPIKVGRRINAAIPGSTLHVFDTGHVPQTSDPAGVAEVLVPFLTACAAAPR